MGAHDNEVHVITLGLGENFIGSVADEHLAGSLDALEMLGNEGVHAGLSAAHDFTHEGVNIALRNLEPGVLAERGSHVNGSHLCTELGRKQSRVLSHFGTVIGKVHRTQNLLDRLHKFFQRPAAFPGRRTALPPNFSGLTVTP